MKGVYERNCPLVDFPGSLEVKTPCSQCRGVGSAPGWESKIHMPCGLKKKKKKCCPYRYHTVVLFVICLYRIDVLTLFKVAASLYTKFLFMAKFGSRLVLLFH